MMVAVDRMRVLEVLADATNVIAEGEVLQLMNMHDPDLAVDDYLRVIRFKTAKLFEASARLGAVLADADRARSRKPAPPTAARSAPPSSSIDDLLDYEGATDAARQERRRRPARRQADAAAADRDGARHAGGARADPPRDRARRGRAPGRDRRRSCAAPARSTPRARPRAPRPTRRASARSTCCRATAYREALLDLSVRSVERSS